MIPAIIKYSSVGQRQEDLFANEDMFSRTKNVIKGLKGVENVYTQHTPQVIKILELMIKNKLKDSLYPFIEGGTRDK